MSEKDIKTVTKEEAAKLSDEDLSKIAGGYINGPFDEANWLGFTEGTWAVGHYKDGNGVSRTWPGFVTGMGCNINWVSGYVGPYTVTILRTFPDGEKGSMTFDVRNCTKE